MTEVTGVLGFIPTPKQIERMKRKIRKEWKKDADTKPVNATGYNFVPRIYKSHIRVNN